MEGIELIVFIIQRGRGDELVRLAEAENISFSLILHGRGTVSSDVLKLLGLGDPEKDVVLLSAEKARAEAVMTALADKLGLSSPGKGVAFMIPFSAAVGQYITYELLSGTLPPESRRTGRKASERKKKTKSDVKGGKNGSLEI